MLGSVELVGTRGSSALGGAFDKPGSSVAIGGHGFGGDSAIGSNGVAADMAGGGGFGTAGSGAGGGVADMPGGGGFANGTVLGQFFSSHGGIFRVGIGCVGCIGAGTLK